MDNFDKKPIVYIGLAEPNVAKFGYTDDIKTRLTTHKREIWSEFTMEYVFESKFNIEIEKKMKQHPYLRTKRFSREYINDKNQTELFMLDDKFTLKHLYKMILDIKNDVEADTPMEIIQKKDIEIEKKDKEIQKLKQKISQRHDKKFIARHIETGEEIVFKSYADAHKIAKIGPHSIKDNYINQAVQCRGWTFRQEKEPWWEPPQPWIFNPEQKASTHMIPCKSTHLKTGQVTYFNSVIEAAQYMHDLDSENFPLTDTNRRTLLQNNQRTKTYYEVTN